MCAVRLTVVSDDLEAEMLCGLLLTNGIRSAQRKTNMAAAISAESGDFTMAGPTVVLVDEAGLDEDQTLLPTAQPAASRRLLGDTPPSGWGANPPAYPAVTLPANDCRVCAKTVPTV